jgi:septal ring factor EnvC (AmiA/AmiB activator)
MIQQIESSAKWQFLAFVVVCAIVGLIFATATITHDRGTDAQQQAALSEQSDTIGDLRAQLQHSRQWNAQLQDQLELARRDLATANATIQSLRSEVNALRNNLTSSTDGNASGVAAQTSADLELARVRLEEAGYMVLALDDGFLVAVLGLTALMLSALLSVVFVAMRRAHDG